jgi:hypothetical protein
MQTYLARLPKDLRLLEARFLTGLDLVRACQSGELGTCDEAFWKERVRSDYPRYDTTNTGPYSSSTWKSFYFAAAYLGDDPTFYNDEHPYEDAIQKAIDRGDLPVFLRLLPNVNESEYVLPSVRSEPIFAWMYQRWAPQVGIVPFLFAAIYEKADPRVVAFLKRQPVQTNGEYLFDFFSLLTGQEYSSARERLEYLLAENVPQ